MVLQYKNLLINLKKNCWIILLLFLLYFGNFIISKISLYYNFDIVNLFIFLGGPFKSFNIISSIYVIYQVVLIFFFSFNFIYRDVLYSIDNIALRSNEKSFIINKILVSFLFIIVFKVIQFLFLYILFNDKVDFKIIYFIYSLVFSFLINSFSIFTFCFNKYFKYIILIASIFVINYFVGNFNVYLCLFISLLINALTIVLFKFKRIIN